MLLLLLLQVSSKLESVLQQQSSEREEQQEQLQELSQQLADTQDQVALLQQVRWKERPCCIGWLLHGWLACYAELKRSLSESLSRIFPGSVCVSPPCSVGVANPTPPGAGRCTCCMRRGRHAAAGG